MSNKLITVDQLQAAMQKLIELTNTKLNSEENYMIPVTDSICFPDLSISTTQHELVLVSNFFDERITIPLDKGTSPGEVVTASSDGHVNDLCADYIKGGGDDSAYERIKYYCFPTSSPTARTLATIGGRAGGVILTSRDRSYETFSYTSVAGEEPINVDLTYNTYTILEAGSGATFNFPEPVPGRVDEYWIEVIINNPIDSPIYFSPGRPIIFATELTWPDGEPDWRTMQATRVQIHIMNGIATYVTVPHGSGSETDHSEHGDPINIGE